jgi:hypothetical protein
MLEIERWPGLASHSMRWARFDRLGFREFCNSPQYFYTSLAYIWSGTRGYGMNTLPATVWLAHRMHCIWHQCLISLVLSCTLHRAALGQSQRIYTYINVMDSLRGYTGQWNSQEYHLHTDFVDTGDDHYTVTKRTRANAKSTYVVSQVTILTANFQYQRLLLFSYKSAYSINLAFPPVRTCTILDIMFR